MKQYGLFIILVLLTLSAYWPVYQCNFVNYDDDEYVSDNPQLRLGLTPAGIKWAFTTGHSSNWHPITWLSLLLDYELFGSNPTGYHLVNLLLHIANAIMLFFLLQKMTSRMWPSALAAAIFSVHPLHVESVAWIAERKDLLSTFWALMAILCYLQYIRSRQLRTYVTMLVFFALSLMAKPMFVTLPFLLLMIDFWPLTRFGYLASSSVLTKTAKGKGHKSKPAEIALVSGRQLIIEKIPLMLLALLSSLITIAVQKSGGAMGHLDQIGLTARLGNALVAYCSYIGKMFWFGNLAVFYPHPGQWPIWQIILSALFLLGISGLAIRGIRTSPWLVIGWFWFLGTLVPVIGIVQVGTQFMADRYSYFPSIGLLIMACWSIPWEFFNNTMRRRFLIGAAAVGLITLSFFTQRQVGYWRDSIRLFEHALQVTKDSSLANMNLGSAYMRAGKYDQAIKQYRKTLALYPDSAQAHNELAKALMRIGDLAQAIDHFQKALDKNPNSADTHNSMGTCLAQKGDRVAAIQHYRQALAIKPDFSEALNNLGIALVEQGNLIEAIQQYRQALAILPEYADAHNNLGVALIQLGKVDEAIEHFREAVRLQPDHAGTRENLLRALAIKR